MGIKVIEQSTAERKKETWELFLKCKPHLDEGKSLRQAIIAETDRKGGFQRSGWYRDLKEVCKQEGYGDCFYV